LAARRSCCLIAVDVLHLDELQVPQEFGIHPLHLDKCRSGWLLGGIPEPHVGLAVHCARIKGLPSRSKFSRKKKN